MNTENNKKNTQDTLDTLNALDTQHSQDTQDTPVELNEGLDNQTYIVEVAQWGGDGVSYKRWNQVGYATGRVEDIKEFYKGDDFTDLEVRVVPLVATRIDANTLADKLSSRARTIEQKLESGYVPTDFVRDSYEAKLEETNQYLARLNIGE
jgi:hypothetical protein